MGEAYIIDACRTPRGRRKGSLREVHPIDLLGVPLNGDRRAHRHRPARRSTTSSSAASPRPASRAPTSRARAVLAAGWPVDVPGVTLNRFCGSGQQAVNFAAQAVKSGAQDLVVAGGVENMTRVPMGADMGPLPASLMEKYNLVPQGLSAEMIAEQWDFSRQQLDEFALGSQQKAWRAIQEGRFKKSIVPIDGDAQRRARRCFDTDEHCARSRRSTA